uniref:Uncharacterized protein n=1 Tax=Glossina palpalis gambiensis TaxID=67801 RepID=A0A1B0ATP4_9MUSC
MPNEMRRFVVASLKDKAFTGCKRRGAFYNSIGVFHEFNAIFPCSVINLSLPFLWTNVLLLMAACGCYKVQRKSI